MPSFTNRATLSYNGISVESNTVTGNINQLLTVTKTALPDNYGANSRITYVISLVNSGSTAFRDLTLSDDLGSYVFGNDTLYPLTYVDGSILYLSNGTPSNEPNITADPSLVIEGISVPASGNATIIYEADVNSFAPLDIDGTITNTVTVNGAGLPEPLIADDTISTSEEPSLSITKALSPLTVNENDEITYTFVISNSGNTAAVATDNVIVTDLFDPILDISSVTLDGAPLTLGTGYTYNANTGLFETVAGVITVPAAAYVQNADGSYTITPSSVTLTVTGRI